MIVVGHQPQYLPYIGILNKVAIADRFVFVDNVQFNKKSWQNRTLIKSNQGDKILLTIPVITKDRFSQKIKDVQIKNNHWIKKHIRSITLNYKKTVGFDEVFPFVEKNYKSESKFLIDITVPLMEEVFKLLNINIPVFLGSELGIEGSKTELLVDMCIKTKSDTYLSGEGAKNYYDPEIFKRYKLNHAFNEFKHPVYSQQGNNFLEGMAIIDLLFNEGTENARKIFWDNANKNKPFK